MLLKTDVFSPQRFTSKGTAVIKGKEIPYETVCEDNVFYAEDGSPEASLFSYSYFRSDVEDRSGRPVLFCFNGGPGSSSTMVHVGFLGPVRVKYGDVDGDGVPLPPYEAVNNDDCLLDIADIVIMDAIGTGYGRLLNEAKKDKYWGTEPDAEACLTFVQSWLTRYKRWKSPKYIVGESYGCTRGAKMIGMGASGTDRSYGVAFDGAVFIGNTVSTFKERAGAALIYPVMLVPTAAAVNWYHNRPTRQSCEEFAKEAAAWADEEYLAALYKGEELSSREREKVIKKLMYYTGVSRKYLEDRDLIVDPVGIRSEIAAEYGLHTGRLDARVTRPLFEPLQSEFGPEKGGSDPSAVKYDPLFEGVLLGTVAPMLGIDSERNFVSSQHLWKTWNRELKGPSTADCLSDAMRNFPTMKVLFMNGWYDLATVTGAMWYMLRHSHLPMDRVDVKYYETGHMVYLGEDKVKKVNDDIREFLMKD